MKTNQHKILFPIDFSGCSSDLIHDVLDVSGKYQSEIHLIYVARTFGYYSTIYVDSAAIQDLENTVMSGAQRSLSEFRNQYLADYSHVRHSVLHGDAAEEIVRYATVYDIDMIIMGTHGRKALAKLFLGSVTQRVVQSSPIPVLTINPFLKNTPSD